jgi:hypothetical protein
MNISPRDRRRLMIFGGITVAAALVFFLFIHKSAKPTEAVLPLPQVSQSAPAPAPTPTGKHKHVLVFSGRDPFCCNPTTNLISSTGPVSSVSPAGSPSSGPNGGSSSTFNGQTIVLVSIFNSGGQDQAQVEVDGTVYTVSPGDNFAGDFTLVSINGTCADFTFQSTGFTLCETAHK